MLSLIGPFQILHQQTGNRSSNLSPLALQPTSVCCAFSMYLTLLARGHSVRSISPEHIVLSGVYLGSCAYSTIGVPDNAGK